ncbi:uncharacterized protein [Clytia hemisphaerica]|uniref:Uncharacterized protein n=1 Tax=Clytia hemisphaerica TaxID=252671 RepID=A0A7M5WRS1_9CNID
MIYMVEYLSDVCTFGVACYIIFGFAIIPSFVRYPKHTSAVHYVFLLFHFCDGILGYIFLMLEKSSFHLWLLCFEFIASIMISIFLNLSSIERTWCLSWAVFSLIQIRIKNGLLGQLKSLDRNVPDDNAVDWMQFLDHKISEKPKVITYCQVFEPDKFVLPSRRIIWREEKTFEYNYWIDLTDQIEKEDCDKALIMKVEFDVQFDDDETEKMYQEHVQNLLDELPEYCKNGRKVVQRIIKIDDQKTNEVEYFYDSMFLKAYAKLIFQTLLFPATLIRLFSWVIKQLNLIFFVKSIMIKKVISSRNIEAC